MAEAGTAQSGIELTLQNGNVIKAANAEEALKIAAKMIEDNSTYAREQKAALEQLRTEFTTFQSQVQQANRPKVEPGSFDKEHYYKLLSEDPLIAQNYLDSHRFGIGDPAQVPNYFTGAVERLGKMEMMSLGAQFASMHPEFPNDSEPASEMTRRVQELYNQGHPVNIDTMELAWGQLQSEGKVKPVEEAQGQEEIPPSPTGAGASFSITDSDVSKAENMNMQELETFLRTKGMIK